MSDFFPKLEPPPGGIARLRRSLDEQTEPRLFWRPILAGAATLALLALALLLPRSTSPHVQLALLSAPAQPVVARDGSAVERVSASEAVVFYRVDSLVATAQPD